MRLSIPSKRRRGFTLIEVLLVLVILVVLGSIVVTAYMPIERSAKIKAAKSQILAFKNALRFYRLDMADYPSTAMGLEALRSPPTDAVGGVWNGPYLEDPVPLDPWGQPYGYEWPSRMGNDKPDIWSCGPDGISGTEDDVVSWAE